jgi:hypothetical protein
MVIDYFSLVFDENEADVMYGENQNEYFKGPYRTKITHTPHDEINLINAFGLTSGEQFDGISIPKWTFTRDCSAAVAPKDGDVIYFHYNQQYYEVVNINDDMDIFLSKKMTWMFDMKPYRMTNTEHTESPEVSANTYPLSAWGDNDFIEVTANEIDDLSDLPNFTDLYGVGD